jgi:hypothetical protein
MPSGVYKRTVKHKSILNNNFCECGCGERVTKLNNRFIHGHNSKGKNNPMYGKIHSKEKKLIISVTTKEAMVRPDVKARQIAVQTEVQNRPDIKARKSVAQKGIPLSLEHIVAIKEGHNTPEYLEDNSRENHWNWQGGKKGINYHLNFNEFFKRKIRTRDNNICQICGKTHEDNLKETGQSLSVHHIHYDSETNNCLNDFDFITLCNSCHMVTNSDREYWENYFIMQMLLVA